MWCPLPGSPSRFSTGTLQSLSTMGHVDDPRIPSLCSSWPTVRPGVPVSTRNAENCSPSILAKIVNRSAIPALEIHIFSPLSRQFFPSELSFAVVRMFIASEPADVSYNADQESHSP